MMILPRTAFLSFLAFATAKTGSNSRRNKQNLLQLGEPPVHLQRRRGLQDEENPFENCTDTVPRFFREENLGTGRCIEGWDMEVWQYYPYDFQGITNKVKHYVCPASNKRFILSNGMPDHAVRVANPNLPCEKFWYLELPLVGTYLENTLTEPSPAGMVAMARNGVPIFGAKEAFMGNAVEPANEDGSVRDAQFWYGHATGLKVEHYHNPDSGNIVPTSETFIGFALDGFKIYGPLEDPSVLDECNGLLLEDGTYQYHVRTPDQVDDSLDYCMTDSEGNPSAVVQWNYIVGCFHGDTSLTDGYSTPDLESITLPDDCMLDTDPDLVQDVPTPPTDTRPNIIIMQPDDLPFYNIWNSPPNNPAAPDEFGQVFPANFTMPNIQKLLSQGLQMTQAYTTSPACGTSRFSTISGKYPSRSAFSREKSTNGDINRTAAKVTIPRTKLQDVEGYGNDCTEGNLMVEFQKNGYRTGVVGKYHLFSVDNETYSYSNYTDRIKVCGFDFAEAIFAENLDDPIIQADVLGTDEQVFTHNMEWVTAEGVNFINADYDGADDDKPFIMYFNPTVPHSSGNVTEALTDDRFVCTVTADIDNNPLPSDPVIKGMTLEYGGCKPYRETVGRRAGGIMNSNENLGAVWVDDSVGALIHALIDKGVFENTIFLFQLDHGVEAKQTLYENGSRIFQFIHYPKEFGTEGKTFDGLVSTIDIAPTMFDFADITGHYPLDGQSWKNAIDNAEEEEKWKTERCLLFENQFDRAVRCGCRKFMTLRSDDQGSSDASVTYNRGVELGYNANFTQFVDLCDAKTRDPVNFPNDNPEAINFFFDGDQPNPVQSIYRDVLRCYRNITLVSADPDFDTDCSLLYRPVFVENNSCFKNKDCEGSTIGAVCKKPFGVCVECKSNQHCIGNLAGEICDRATNTCVDYCTRNGDCAGNAAGEVCGANSTCVECKRNEHCVGNVDGREICDRDITTCVDYCTRNGDCTGNVAGEVCGDNSTCVECKRNEHCIGNLAGEVCDRDINICVDYCTRNGDCEGNAAGEVCGANSTCVECKRNEHCIGNIDGEICDRDINTCVDYCTRNGDCAGNTAGEVCGNNNTCVQCKRNSHCDGETIAVICDSGINMCVECKNDNHCEGGGQSCQGSQCVDAAANL